MAKKKQAKISAHVEATGEAQYKKTIADCRKEAELFKAEQKLIEDQFKKTGDQEQYNASMANLLRRKLERIRNLRTPPTKMAGGVLFYFGGLFTS